MTVRVVPFGKKPGTFMVDVRFRWPDGEPYRDRKVLKDVTLTQAKSWGSAHEREVFAKGKPKPEEKPKPAVTFKDFVDKRWWPVYPSSKGNAHTTIAEKKCHLDVHLLPYFGDTPMTLKAFNAEAIAKFAAAMTEKTVGAKKKKPLTAKRINNVLATLSRILNSAVEWGVLPAMPKVTRLKAAESPFDYFVRAESEAVIAKARDAEQRALLMFAFHTGARAGEQLAFEWGQIDWHNDLIVFRRSRTAGVTTEATKSRRIRRVPMTASLHAALKAMKHLKGPLVFCDDEGKPLTINMLHERLWSACRRAGLREIRWHDCRHSFASQLVMAGTPLRQVQEWMGHSTIAMTMRYAHLAPGGGREFIAALDGQTHHAVGAKRARQ